MVTRLRSRLQSRPAKRRTDNALDSMTWCWLGSRAAVVGDLTNDRGARPPQVIRMIRIVRDLSNVGRFVEWIRISIRQQISSPSLHVSLPV